MNAPHSGFLLAQGGGTVGNACRMVSVTVYEIILSMNDILYAQSGDPSFPKFFSVG